MEKILTTKEAYLAMVAYLENLYELTKSDDLAVILGSMQLMEDGSTIDSAYWYDWLEAIEKIKNSHISTKPYNVNRKARSMITKETVTDFFNDLDKKGDFDYSMPLPWGFFFLGTDLKKLKSLGTELEFKGYRFVDVFEAEMESKNDPQEYYFYLERVEIHSIESIMERNEELYEVADKYSVGYDGFDVGQIE